MFNSPYNFLLSISIIALGLTSLYYLIDGFVKESKRKKSQSYDALDQHAAGNFNMKFFNQN